jgi:hypothetical protein
VDVRSISTKTPFCYGWPWRRAPRLRVNAEDQGLGMPDPASAGLAGSAKPSGTQPPIFLGKGASGAPSKQYKYRPRNIVENPKNPWIYKRLIHIHQIIEKDNPSPLD